MAMNPTRVYVPISEVFPHISNDPETFKSLLKQLSRTDTLFSCARLNLILSNPANGDRKSKHEYGLRMFFTSEEIDKINRFARAHPDVERIGVFFRGQLLELIRWACLLCDEQPDDGTTFKRPEVRRTFAQAALMASDLWAHRVYREGFSLEGGREVARRRALSGIRVAIGETTSGMDPLKALGRGKALLCERLPQFYPKLEHEFRARTQLSLDEYYICLAAFMTHYVNRTPENAVESPGIFNVNTICEPVPHMKPILSQYFALESQTADELREALWGQREVVDPAQAGEFNFKPLRRRPILRASDGRAIILDPVLYAERASVGPLFWLIQGMPREEGDKLLADFGYAFEAYARDILRRMYPEPGSGLVNRLTSDVKGRDQQGHEVQIADACLNDVTELVLFEMKASWVRDEAVLDDDYERYLDELRKKYGVSTGDGAGHSIKGVGQLARTISKLADREWTPIGQDFSAVQRIYPILLVHDPLLAAPVHGNFLASEFATALTPDELLQSGDMKKGPFRVTPLIMMTIEDLEGLETSVEHFSLRELLRDYSSACSDRIVSLQNFLTTSEYRRKIYHSRSVASKTLQVLEKSMRMLFPTANQQLDDS